MASGFGVVAFAAAWWHTRTGAMRTVAAADSSSSARSRPAIYVVLTGDAGAQVAWFNVEG